MITRPMKERGSGDSGSAKEGTQKPRSGDTGPIVFWNQTKREKVWIPEPLEFKLEWSQHRPGAQRQ